eukprot:13417197-Alexandrium_andersonii.AAC.1
MQVEEAAQASADLDPAATKEQRKALQSALDSLAPGRDDALIQSLQTKLAALPPVPAEMPPEGRTIFAGAERFHQSCLKQLAAQK